METIYPPFILFFFFQAEDGIRDCLLSRGLGDVYKRQVLVSVRPASSSHREVMHRLALLERFLCTLEGVLDRVLSLCGQVNASICLHILLRAPLVEASPAHDFKLALVADLGLASSREGSPGEHKVNWVVNWRSESLVLHGLSVSLGGAVRPQELVLIEGAVSVVRLLALAGVQA